MRTSILTLLLLLPPVCSFANTEVAELPLAATAKQNGTRGVEAKKISEPIILNGKQDFPADAQPIVPGSATEAKLVDSDGDSTSISIDTKLGMPPAQENTFVGVTSPLRLASAESRIPVSSADKPGLFMIAPGSAIVVPHRFFDRENLIGVIIHAAIRTADVAQTCILLGRGAREAWLPMKGCPGIAAYSFSMIPAQIGNAYLLHRSGHHKLERWAPYLWSAPSAAGIAVSLKAW